VISTWILAKSTFSFSLAMRYSLVPSTFQATPKQARLQISAPSPFQTSASTAPSTLQLRRSAPFHRLTHRRRIPDLTDISTLNFRDNSTPLSPWLTTLRSLRLATTVSIAWAPHEQQLIVIDDRSYERRDRSASPRGGRDEPARSRSPNGHDRS
jgi:hypothetical protein